MANSRLGRRSDLGDPPAVRAIAGPLSVCPGQSAKNSVTQDGGLRRISCVEIGVSGSVLTAGLAVQIGHYERVLPMLVEPAR